MTTEAFYLLIISGGLFSFFFISILGTWLFQYFSELTTNKLRKQLEERLSSYVDAENEKKRSDIQKISHIVGNSARRKELLIDTIISSGDDFIETHHDMLMNFYEVTGIKAFLLKRLRSDNVYINSLACRYLGELKLKGMEANIIELISSKNNDVIYNVMLALAKLGDMKGLVHILINESKHINLSHRAIIEVISVFNGSKEDLFKNTFDLSDDYIKGVLIKATADYRIEGLSEYYINYLSSEDKNLRISSIRALCELNNQDYEDYIISRLHDNDWEVRAAAAKGLVKLGTRKCFMDLGKATGDSVWWVRQNAASTLIHLPGGTEYAYNIINGDDEFAREAVVSVIEMTS